MCGPQASSPPPVGPQGDRCGKQGRRGWGSTLGNCWKVTLLHTAGKRKRNKFCLEQKTAGRVSGSREWMAVSGVCFLMPEGVNSGPSCTPRLWVELHSESPASQAFPRDPHQPSSAPEDGPWALREPFTQACCAVLSPGVGLSPGLLWAGFERKGDGKKIPLWGLAVATAGPLAS